MVSSGVPRDFERVRPRDASNLFSFLSPPKAPSLVVSPHLIMAVIAGVGVKPRPAQLRRERPPTRTAVPRFGSGTTSPLVLCGRRPGSPYPALPELDIPGLSFYPSPTSSWESRGSSTLRRRRRDSAPTNFFRACCTLDDSGHPPMIVDYQDIIRRRRVSSRFSRRRRRRRVSLPILPSSSPDPSVWLHHIPSHGYSASRCRFSHRRRPIHRCGRITFPIMDTLLIVVGFVLGIPSPRFLSPIFTESIVTVTPSTLVSFLPRCLSQMFSLTQLLPVFHCRSTHPTSSSFAFISNSSVVSAELLSSPDTHNSCHLA